MRYMFGLLVALLLCPLGASATTKDEVVTPTELGCGPSTCQLPNWSMPYKLLSYNGNWSRQIVLPYTHQGLVVDVESEADFTSSIVSDPTGSVSPYLDFTFGDFKVNAGVNIHKGDHFIFNMVKTRSGYAWNPVGDSVRYMQAARDGASMPNSPRLVIYQTSDGNWYKDIYLPEQPADDQIVIVHSDAGYSSQLHGSSKGPVIATLSKGQTLIFKYVGKDWVKVASSDY